MRSQIKITISVWVLATFFFGLSGCRTLSGPGQWFQPKSKRADLETAPEFRGQSGGDAFSSRDATPISMPNDPSVNMSGATVSSVPPRSIAPAAPEATISGEQPPFPFEASAPSTVPPSVPPTVQPPVTAAPAADPWMTAVSPSNPAAPPLVAQAQPLAPTANQVVQPPAPEQLLPQTMPGTWGATPTPLSQAPVVPQPGFSAERTPDPWDDPWGLPGGDVRNAVSIEAAAKEEEDARERARLTELATARQKDGMPEYLKPLETWNGPFASREKKETIEQDIIRQVGHVDVISKPYDNTPVFDWEKEEEKGFDWSVLDPVNFFTKVRDWVGLGPDERKANEAMKKGREMMLANPDLKDRSKSLAAAKHFMEAAKRWPDSVLEEDALHLAGECYFFGDDYPRALKAYQKLIIKYQHSKHVDNSVRRLFAIGRYWEKEDRRGVSFVNAAEKSRPTFDTFGYCQKAYETIFIHDPNGPISDDAVMALASAYLAKGKYQGDSCYEKAAYYYNYLRENYPLSKHIAKAHEYELFARTHAYMGAEHSGKTLDEAGKLAEVTLRQFSSELDGEDKEEILSLKEGVIERQAEREWTLGQYYEKKQYYGSARLYYNKLLDQYPQTVFAEKARGRIEEIRDKPERPDQFGFFKKLYMPRGSY